MKIDERWKHELRSIMRNYCGMTRTVKRRLYSLGFAVVEGKKHYKLFFGDNPRPMALAKTPSDFRCGKNAARDIIRMFC